MSGLSAHNKILVDVVGALARFAVRCRQINGGEDFYRTASVELAMIIWRLSAVLTPETLVALITELDDAKTLEDVLEILTKARATDAN